MTVNKHPVYEVWCYNEKTGSFTNSTDDPAAGHRSTSVRRFATAVAIARTSGGFSWYGRDFNGDHFMVVRRDPDGTRQCVTGEVESPAVTLRNAVATHNQLVRTS